MSDFLSIIAVKRRGKTYCTVKLSPKGKEYKVVCEPDQVYGRLSALFDREQRRRRVALQTLEYKHKKVLDKIMSGDESGCFEL